MSKETPIDMSWLGTVVIRALEAGHIEGYSLEDREESLLDQMINWADPEKKQLTESEKYELKTAWKGKIREDITSGRLELVFDILKKTGEGQVIDPEAEMAGKVFYLDAVAKAFDPRCNYRLKTSGGGKRAGDAGEEGVQGDAISVGGKIIGRLKIPTFYSSGGITGGGVDGDVADYLDWAKERGVGYLIIDLRGCVGGEVVAMSKVLGNFIHGRGFYVENRGGDVHEYHVGRGGGYSGLVGVLVDHTTTSAGEIFALAMQSHRRGLILGGERTYGKGSIQTYLDLTRFAPDSGGWKSYGTLGVTTGYVLGPNMEKLHKTGVVPDIAFLDRQGRRQEARQVSHPLGKQKTLAENEGWGCEEMRQERMGELRGMSTARWRNSILTEKIDNGQRMAVNSLGWNGNGLGGYLDPVWGETIRIALDGMAQLGR